MSRVLKVGGAVCKDEALVATLAAAWHQRPENWILVHGGGPQLTAALADIGEDPQRINGLRVTTPKAAEVVATTMDDVGARLTAVLDAHGLPARHVPGRDKRLRAVRKQDPPGLGRVGTSTHFDARRLKRPSRPQVFVVTPVGWDERGPLNVNADEAAITVTTSFDARQLAVITDVPGVMDASGTVLPTLGAEDVRRLLADGTAKGGMIPKLENALEALEKGVAQVLIGPASSIGHPQGTRIGGP